MAGPKSHPAYPQGQSMSDWLHNLPVVWIALGPCCTDQQPGAVSPPQRHLREANVLRPAKLEHAVQRGGSNGHLGRPPASGPRAQRVTDHSLVATDIGLHQGTPIVTKC